MKREAPQLAPSEQQQQPPPRRDLDRPLTVLQIQPDQRRTFFGYASSISVGGMRIDATSPREPGTRYRLEIPLPTPMSTVVLCDCEVIWKRDYSQANGKGPGMGLRFLELPEAVVEALDAWIQREAFLDGFRRKVAC